MLIREMTREEEHKFFGRNDPCLEHLSGAFIDGECVAVCGVMRDPRFYGSMFEEDGRWIGFLQLLPTTKPLGAQAVIEMRRWMQRFTAPIEVQHHDEHPKAEKLLQVLGFKPTDRFEADHRKPSRKLRIWKWQPSAQSPA